MNVWNEDKKKQAKASYLTSIYDTQFEKLETVNIFDVILNCNFKLKIV